MKLEKILKIAVPIVAVSGFVVYKLYQDYKYIRDFKYADLDRIRRAGL